MGGYSPPSGDQYEVLADALRTLSERLSELELPTGTSLNSLVDQVQQAIADINTTVTAAIAANSYTQAQINSRIAAPPYAVSTSTDLTVGGQFKAPDVASFVITGTRYAVWVETATGRQGNTISSRRYKTNERPANIDPLAVLSLEPKVFNYIAEIRKRDDPDFEEYVGPEYVVADEYGFMAEDLHAAGLTHLVYYVPDENGNPRPHSVDYVMFAVTLLAAVRHLADGQSEISGLRDEVAELRAAVRALTQNLES